MRSTSTEAALARSSLLRDLSQEDLAHIAALVRRRSYRRGEVIFHEGDPGDSLHVVESGRVKVFVYAKSGSETLFSIVGPGESFGELALLDGEPRSATVQALEPVETVTIRQDEFLTLLRTHPETMERVLVALAAKIRYLTDVVSDLAFLDLEGAAGKEAPGIGRRARPRGGGRHGDPAAPHPGRPRCHGWFHPGECEQVVGVVRGSSPDQPAGRRIALLDPERLRRRIT